MNKPITFDNLTDLTTFRFADVGDAPVLAAMLERYHAETVLKDFLEFELDRAHATISEGIANEKRPYILAVVDGGIVGFLSFVLDYTYYARPCLVMIELYVLPEFRRSAIGRALVAIAILEGKRLGAAAFHAALASGLDETRSLLNLFSKAGFEHLGAIMRRGL
jgi:GNAT superfamily N-acetyltransferase